MAVKDFFFAGGGTGGHIYPALAVAERIAQLEPKAGIHFFISSSGLDEKILSHAGFSFTVLPACGFSFQPVKFKKFISSFLKSRSIALKRVYESKNAVVLGVGGFVAAPVCMAAHKLSVPVKILNVDIVPGRANKLIRRFADEVFVQFEETAEYFVKKKLKVNVVGCPLRCDFDNPKPERIIEQLGLDRDKKILLITGASSGAKNINDCVCSLLPWLSRFADNWQIVHLTGRANFQEVESAYSGVKISHKVLDYCDNMADLLSAADLGIGRSGAVSVAEYASSSLAMICMPYPYHKDMHQYLNAGKLVEAGAAIIVDDLPDENDRKQWLAEELEELVSDENKLKEMAENCKAVSNPGAGLKIANKLLGM